MHLELAETQITFSSQDAHSTTVYRHGFVVYNCVIHKLALICVMRYCQVRTTIPHSLIVPYPTATLVTTPGDNIFNC